MHVKMQRNLARGQWNGLEPEFPVPSSPLPLTSYRPCAAVDDLHRAQRLTDSGCGTGSLAFWQSDFDFGTG